MIFVDADRARYSFFELSLPEVFFGTIDEEIKGGNDAGSDR